MEKPGRSRPRTEPTPRQPWRRTTATTTLVLLLLVLAGPWSLPRRPGTHHHDDHQDRRPFEWSSLTPSPVLTYTPCFDRFQCARLTVPLNWNATDAGGTAALALIKLPARVPITDPRYGGAVVVNPGGPGESGVFQVLTDGDALQIILDSGNLDSTFPADDDGQFYDIVSFDPRGVNNTTPALDCFPTAFHQQAWQLSMPDYGLLWDSERIVGLEWARAAALGASCSAHPDSILPYTNTAQTAEDLVRIIEQLGQWRAAEAVRLLHPRSRLLPAHLQYHPGAEQLQYWGVSYGTVLGATFAARHPARVRRMILDGVVDPADHYAGGWLTQLQDSDTIVTKFCEYCHRAGPAACPLYTGTSAAAIEARFTAILQKLKEAPIAVDGGAGPVFLTYGDAHLLLLSGMYFPFAMADELFAVLPALESRNGSDAVLAGLAARKLAALAPDRQRPYVSAMGAVQSIACMDSGDGGRALTRAQFAAYLAELGAQSRWISPSWARNKLACQGFATGAAWRPDLRFDAPLTAPAHPLLVLGNSHDTVTPLRNARRLASLFPGSVLVQQDSEGHCSHSTPSLCTARTVRRYMRTGELPAAGTVCPPDVRPFVGCIADTKCQFDSEDIKMWEALVTLADPFKLSGAGGKDIYSLWL